MTASSPVTVPLDDIQAGVFDPQVYAYEKHLWAKVTSADRARDFLRSIVDTVSNEAEAAAVPKPPTRLNVGFSWAGLAAMEISTSTLASFPNEFRVGMAGRALVLGDNGASAPTNWDAPYGSPDLHIWLMAQADDQSALAGLVAKLTADAAQSNGIAFLGDGEDGAQLPPEFSPAKEHFGFNDNLSQPGVEGVGQPVHPGQGTLLPDGTWEPIPVGCFLLGYPNGFGETVNQPDDSLLRKNGTYMVFRKLYQDVAKFRSYVAETASLLGIDEGLCAAKFVGRWKSGAPLERCPVHDDPTVLDHPETANDFAYEQAAPESDADGSRVPHFAHIRRVNPRDALGPNSLVNPKNHRIIRRSAPYGPYLPEGNADNGKDRGLLFRAFNASILDQFELIQNQWVNSANAAHGLSSDRDPFVGSIEPVGRIERQLGASFTIPQPDGSCPTRYDLPRFVTVRGGEYLFIPGIEALRHLAAKQMQVALPVRQPIPDFVQAYQAVSSDHTKSATEIAMEQTGLVLAFQDRLVELGDSLRRSDDTKIFPTPIGVLLSTHNDIAEVFARSEVFSVSGYGDRLAQLAGPFMLGLDAGPQYEHETSVMRLVAPSSELPTLGRWIDQYAASVVTATAKQGSTFDLVSTIANRVPLAFVDRYFGVPGPDDQTFMSWLRVIGVHVFEFWSPLDPRILQTAAAIAPTFNSYLDGLVNSRMAAVTAEDQSVPDDVLTRLVKLVVATKTNTSATAMGLDLLGIRRNLLGFALGSSVALSVAIVSAVQYLFSEGNESALAQTVGAARAGDDTLVGECMLEAARLGAPAPPSLFRTATSDYVLARNTPRQKTILKGSIVALYPIVAMTDPDFLDDPLAFRPGRPSRNYVMFGEGMHTCFGTAIGTTILTSVGKALFRVEGLHQVSPMVSGTGVPGMYYPGVYQLGVSQST